MIPEGFAGVEQQLLALSIAMLRPGAALAAAPIFSTPAVPVIVRLLMALALGLAGAGQIYGPAPATIYSLDGLMLIAGEVLVSATLGFILHIGFASAVLAGEAIGNTMGFGLAVMNDPLSGASNPVLGQLLMLLASLLFLACNGHLLFFSAIVASYDAMPLGGASFDGPRFYALALLGGSIFASGVVIAAPVCSAILLLQLLGAMLSRSAPQLNLFSIGFTAAALSGTLALGAALPVMASIMIAAQQDAIDAMPSAVGS